MRCRSCNVTLTLYEETAVYDWGEQIELCNNCLQDVDIHPVFNNDYIDVILEGDYDENL